MPWWAWLLVIWVVGMVGILLLWSFVRREQKVRDSGFLPDVRLWRDDSAPFMLVLDEAVTNARVVEACAKAIQFWNEHVPGIWVAFGEVSAGVTIPVMPSWKLATWAAETTCSAFGYTRLTTKDDRVWAAGVYIDADRMDDLTDLQLWRAIAHELGHVLGLAHDDARMSVMHPQALDERPTVTASDRALLVGVYT